MAGPDRSVHGGISGVVNQYYAAGIDQRIRLRYIGTMKEGSRFGKLFTAAAAYFRFLLCVRQYDIVHINMASDMSYVRKSFFVRAAARCGKPIVLHQHGGDFEGYYASLSEEKRKRVREVFDMASVVLVLAPAWKEFFGTITDPDKIVVFPDAIPIGPVVRKEYARRNLLFLGRLCRNKGIGELLEAVRELKPSYPDLKLYLGGIWEEEDLQRMADAEKDSVVFKGWVTGEEKRRLLEEASVFVMPSYFEGQSVAIMEAMETSCAIVASDTGGIPMMIDSGVNGLLVPVRDKDALRDAIESLLCDPGECRRLGEAARARVEKDFALDENMEKLLGIYEEIMKGNENR